MSRTQIMKTVLAIWLTAFVFKGADAQSPQFAQPYQQPTVQFTGGVQPTLLPAHSSPNRTMRVSQQQAASAPMAMQPAPGQFINDYPHTGAPLYPSPVPNVPHQVGGTMHTNQAFYPHEMLYAHKYRSMYPPFYYVVKGGWVVTPFGVKSNDVWRLAGTEVEVNYKTRYGLFSGFGRFYK